MPEGELSVALTVLRAIRGWTQEDLARASGVRASSLSEYERGRKVPELKTLQRLVAAMGFPLSALDHAQSFIHTLRTESVFSGRLPLLQGQRNPQRPREDEALERSDGGDASDAGLQWEVEQVSAEAGRVVTRLTRLLFVFMSQPPAGPDNAGP
jgi:transcriptional regulator with XRE-family HTH domain